jgi:hypothetical protein
MGNHSGCRPEWKALGQRKGESDEQHTKRLKGTFVFSTELSTEVVSHVDETAAPGISILHSDHFRTTIYIKTIPISIVIRGHGCHDCCELVVTQDAARHMKGSVFVRRPAPAEAHAQRTAQQGWHSRVQQKAS